MQSFVRPFCLLLVALTFAAACTHAALPPAVAAPKGSDAVLHREVAPLAKVAVVEGAFSAQVESSGTPQLTNNAGLRQVVIPIGTEQPLRCFVYPKSINLAQTLRLFINSVAQHVSKHQIDDLDAGEVGGLPYLAVNTSYRVDGDGETQASTGQVKYLASRSDSTTTLCMHDEPGYQQSFARIVKGFIGAQKWAQGDADSARKLMVWRAVSVQRTGLRSVGVIESRLYEGESGYAFASSRSTLVPSADGQVIASDEAENQFSNVEGEVLEGKYVKIIDDAVSYSLDLSLQGQTQYRVAGTYRGAAFSANIAVQSALLDFASQSARVRKLFAGQGNQALHWTVFSPNDPTRIAAVAFAKVGVRQAVVTSEGNKKSQLEVDNLGIPSKATSDGVTIERVYQDKHSS